MRKRSENTVYTKAEAQQAGLQWLHWRDPAVVRGSYVISDDDMVLKVLNVYECVNSRGYKNRLVRTALAMCSQEFSRQLRVADDSAKRHNIGNSRHCRTSISVREKRVIDLYVSGVPLLEAFNTVFSVKPQRLKSVTSQMLKKEGVIRYMTEALKAAFAKMGITEEFIAQNLKELITDPDSRATDRLESLKYASRLAGIEQPRISGRQITRGYFALTDDEANLLETEQEQELTVG